MLIAHTQQLWFEFLAEKRTGGGDGNMKCFIICTSYLPCFLVVYAMFFPLPLVDFFPMLIC